MHFIYALSSKQDRAKHNYVTDAFKIIPLPTGYYFRRYTSIPKECFEVNERNFVLTHIFD